MMQAENYCRFIGVLQEFKLYEVEGEYAFGRGVLFLPIGQSDLGQPINITVSGEVARRMNLVNNGSWVTAIGSYMPSIFRGKLQDTFQITAFKVE